MQPLAAEDAADRSPRRLDGRWPRLEDHAVRLLITIFAALGATYVAMGAKTMATGGGVYGFADFHPLWVSGVLAHDGRALINYDSTALHQAQVTLGVDAHRWNPFPYPPTLLLLLAPLGALPQSAAFAVFMMLSGLAFVTAMTLGRLSDWRWWVGALAAPASGITLISGQSGFLTGALMVGGLRLVERRPALAGVLIGLLAFKPQLGLILPVALIAAGRWRVIAAALATVVAGALASSLAFGVECWIAWARQFVEYANQYQVALDLMPTVYAGAVLAGTPQAAALALQMLSLIVAGVVVAKAARERFDARATALIVVGAFLATPHAFNYDMPMTAAAVTAFLIARQALHRPVSLIEAAAVILVWLAPLLALALRSFAGPFEWMALAAFFIALTRRDSWPAASD